LSLEGRSLLRYPGRVIWPLVGAVLVLGTAPAALASGGSPLQPDASPATSAAPAAPSKAASGGLRPDSPQEHAIVKAPAKVTAAPSVAVRPAPVRSVRLPSAPVASAPVKRAAAPVRVAPKQSAPARTVARPALRPVKRHVTPAPVHLGIRYALPPSFGELSRNRLLVPAALALLTLLLSSGSFLGFVYRHRREFVRA
jgi:hypothetical protein